MASTTVTGDERPTSWAITRSCPATDRGFPYRKNGHRVALHFSGITLIACHEMMRLDREKENSHVLHEHPDSCTGSDAHAKKRADVRMDKPQLGRTARCSVELEVVPGASGERARTRAEAGSIPQRGYSQKWQLQPKLAQPKLAQLKLVQPRLARPGSESCELRCRVAQVNHACEDS